MAETELNVETRNRNKLLDVLRAVAIMMVFTAHTTKSFGAPDSIAPLQLGGTGVDLFFVLSGWLIGSQLFAELKRHGNIEVRRFWIRRWMRTLPAYYAVLCYTIIQLSITKAGFSFPFQHFLFIQNYDHPITVFSVSWSLCVEEQFYLVIAPAIVFLGKTKPTTRTLVLSTFLLLPTVFRELDWYTSPKETHVRWDCCVMGILLANIHATFPRLWKSLVAGGSYMAGVSLIAYLGFYYNRWFPSENVSDPSKLVLAFIFGSWIIWANSSKSESSFLGERLIYYISTRSYAIYLLHPDALAVASRLAPDTHFTVYFCFAFVLSCASSEILFRFIEVPFMKMRRNYRFSQSRN